MMGMFSCQYMHSSLVAIPKKQIILIGGVAVAVMGPSIGGVAVAGDENS